MNLIIDQGNTRVKFAIYADNTLKYEYSLDNWTDATIKEICSNYPVKACIFSSVINISKEQLDKLAKLFDKFIYLDQQTSLPIELGYKTPESLGRDRIAGVVGAFSENDGRDILVIDAGTAITYDFINSKGLFQGGNISPGMRLRFQSLNRFTDKLPLVTSEGLTPFCGYDTETAIRAGVINGIIFEIEGYISRFKGDYPDLLVFLTGGDCFFFATKLKNTIFADKNLVLKGLNYILRYNVKK